MQYHLSVPSTALAYSATQIAMMGKLLNREIAAVAAAVSYSCPSFGFRVDGPSVQSTPTQDELEILHPLSFCEGPLGGPPWVIGGDTGIHPSAAGYTQMSSQVPPPR